MSNILTYLQLYIIIFVLNQIISNGKLFILDTGP